MSYPAGFMKRSTDHRWATAKSEGGGGSRPKMRRCALRPAIRLSFRMLSLWTQPPRSLGLAFAVVLSRLLGTHHRATIARSPAGEASPAFSVLKRADRLAIFQAGQPAAWWDYSGRIDGRRGGTTLLAEPESLRPGGWYNRDDGSFVAHPFGP